MTGIDRDFVKPFATGLPPWRRADWVGGGPPPPPFRGIELTQAVQHFRLDGKGLDERENSIPLIGGKELYVRVYLSGDHDDWPGGAIPGDLAVEARLTDDDPRGRWRSPVGKGALGGSRDHAEGSVNAVFPGALCEGLRDLEVAVLAVDAGGKPRRSCAIRSRSTSSASRASP